MYTSLKETLNFYGVDCNHSYYISTGKALFKFPEKPFRMDFYAFCVCTSGSITLEIDNNTYLISENSFLISAPSTIVHFKKSSSNFKMKLLFFEKNFLLKNISNPFIIEKTGLFYNGIYSIVKAPKEAVNNLLKLLQYLELKSNAEGIFTDEIIRSIIFNILLEIAEITHQNTKNISNQLNAISTTYLRFRELVQKHILEQKSIQFYASLLHVSNNYLIEIVKKSSGKTPHQIIDEMLLKEAFVFLGDTELTISQIATLLHFNSTSAFGRFFKKHASVSPSEYRKKQNLTR